MKYLDLAIANEQIKTIGIEKKNSKTGEITVNEYSQVNQRIKAFRMVYPQGVIETEMLSNENGICIFKAFVGYREGNELYKLATGTAYEKEDSTFINKTSYIENCETSAVGRALGMAGFGIDVSVASAEEVQNAMSNQEVTQEEADGYTLQFGKYKGKTLKEVLEEKPEYIDWLLGNSNDERFIKIIELATGKKLPSEKEQQQTLEKMVELHNLLEQTNTDRDKFYNYYKVKNDSEMTLEQLQDGINKLKEKLN